MSQPQPAPLPPHAPSSHAPSPLEPVRLTLDALQRGAFVELGQSLVGQGRWHEASLVFGLLARADTRDSFAHRALGIALFKLQRHAEALSALDTAIRLTPDDAFALAHRALVRMSLEERDAARADAQAASAAFGPSQAPLAKRIRILLRTLPPG